MNWSGKEEKHTILETAFLIMVITGHEQVLQAMNYDADFPLKDTLDEGSTQRVRISESTERVRISESTQKVWYRYLSRSSRHILLSQINVVIVVCSLQKGVLIIINI